MIDDQRKKVRALKRYARELKYQAEDWAPMGQPLPNILTVTPPVSLDDDQDDDFLRRQQSEIDRLKNRNRNLEDDIRKLTDAKPNASVSIEARRSIMDKSVQGSAKDAQSIGMSAIPFHDQSSFDDRALKEELDRYQRKATQYQDEVDRLRGNIRELEIELDRQKNSYVRKSSNKLTPKGDPELDRMKVYIRQLEDEISDLKRQMSSAQYNQKEITDLKRQLQAAKVATPNEPSMYSAAVQKQDDIQERIL